MNSSISIWFKMLHGPLSPRFKARSSWTMEVKLAMSSEIFSYILQCEKSLFRILSRLCRHWSGVPGPYGPWGLSTIKKIIMGLGKKHMAGEVVKKNVRPIKAVGCVFKIVSVYCRRSISDKVATLPGLDHAINCGGDREND